MRCKLLQISVSRSILTLSCTLLMTHDVAAASAPVQGQAPLRLVELLQRKNIVSSPLLEVEAARDLDAVAGKLKKRTLLSEDFESFSAKTMQWPTGTWPRWGTRIAKTGQSNGKAMCYRGGGAHEFPLLISVKANTHYRLSRRVRTSSPMVDLRVLEMKVPLRHPGVRNHADDLKRAQTGKFVRMKDLVYVHRFTKVAAPAVWQTNSLSLQTSKATRSLLLMLDDAESVVSYRPVSSRHAGGSVDVCLDDIVVEEMTPNADQHLALVKGRDNAAGADTKLGMVKHGQLLPTGDAESTRPPFESNFEYRHALLAPAPTALSFTLPLPAQARLNFSYALDKASRPGDGARFQILADGKTIFDEQLKLASNGKNWHWHDRFIDMAAFAGRKVLLELKTSNISGQGLALWGNPIISAPRKAADAPNVVVIAIDTLRADRLSAYGHSTKTSPNMDALARDGILFEHPISASNWTSSAFASLFTGVMPSQHQVIHRARAIAPDYKTLPEYFREAGWLTKAIAFKAYLYNMGFEQGFDNWFNMPRSDNTADDNWRVAKKWLEKHDDERFFLFFHLNDPHQPFNQPAEFATKFADPKLIKQLGASLPLVVGTKNKVHGCARCSVGGKLDERFKPLGRQLYDGEIAFIDNRIGRLIQSLKDAGVYDNTIIAVVADHGEVMWDRSNYFGHGGTMLSDELTRVPLIIKPHTGARLAVGKTIPSQVRTMDLMPTLIDLAGLKTVKEPMQARSLLPMLTSPATETQDRMAISENVKQYVASARFQGWKYVLSHRPGRAVRETLFNLRTDPGEHKNVARRNPKKLASLRTAVLEHFVSTGKGRYVMVLGDGQKRAYKVQVTTNLAQQGARTMMGIEHTINTVGTKHTATFTGVSDKAVVLFARIDVPGDASMAVQVQGDGKVMKPAGGAKALPQGPYVVHNLLAKHTPAPRLSVHVLAGNDRVIAPGERQSIDADQLATLRALGYVQ